ncbi:Crp/Fnr family transcriptional regulator [uncultured Polaribacter sp.]|uniref:Crp/Fnr family transcriptional regulator n=1 Tax=uncultured Polaribacter sp. TaxID=174711 RepID=UPI002610F556|nr:Crp/Fnr family transcriptional regulator [uncultured Polaribacter sp.]
MNEILPPLNEKLKTFSLYDYLKNDLQLNLNHLVTEIEVSKNDYLYRPPIIENFIYEIVDGAMKLGSYKESGEEYVYDVIHSGDFFGNLKYLNNQFYEFSKPLIDTRIRVYDLSFFKRVITENPKTAEWFISYLVKRWCVAEKKLGKVNEKNTIEKIRFLRHFFNVSVKDSQGTPFMLYDLLTQKDMGDLVGTTRQTIANALKKKSIFST